MAWFPLWIRFSVAWHLPTRSHKHQAAIKAPAALQHTVGLRRIRSQWSRTAKIVCGQRQRRTRQFSLDFPLDQDSAEVDCNVTVNIRSSLCEKNHCAVLLCTRELGCSEWTPQLSRMPISQCGLLIFTVTLHQPLAHLPIYHHCHIYIC